jgi:transposase
MHERRTKYLLFLVPLPDLRRNPLANKGIPPTRSRKTPIAFDKALYRRRHKVENMFAKLKDWRRVATCYDRCAHTFFSAIWIAAAVAFYLS